MINGNLDEYEIPINGTKPTSGNLTYENNILKSGCLTFDDYKVDIENGEISTVEKGECPLVESIPIAWTLSDGTRNVSYYEASWVKNNGTVKFDPTLGENGEICTTGSTCYEWHRFGEYKQGGTKYIKLTKRIAGKKCWPQREDEISNLISVDGEVVWKNIPKMITAREVANIAGASRTVEQGGKEGWYNVDSATRDKYFSFNPSTNYYLYGEAMQADENFSWLYGNRMSWTDTEVLDQNTSAWLITHYNGALSYTGTNGCAWGPDADLTIVLTVPASALEQ